MVAPDSPEVVTRILGSPQSDTHHMSSSPSPGPHVPQSPPSRPETPPTPHVPFASSQLPHTPRVRIRSVSVDDHHHEAHQGWVPTESRQGAHYTPSYMPAQARSASQPRLVPCTDYDSDDSDHPFVPNSASPTRGSFSSRSSSSSRSAGLDSSPVSYEQSARRSTLHRDDSAERRQTYQPHPPHAPNVHSCPTCGSSAAPLPSPHHYQHHHYPPPTPVYPPAYLPEHARASVPPYYPPPPIPYALTHASQDYPAVAPAPHAYYPPHSHPHPSYYPPPAPAHAADDPHVAQGHEVASSLGRRQRRVYTDSRGTAYPKRGRVDDYSSSDSSESSADE
ncbi:hypothetical protein BDW22DRAFT_1399519 [Trametopsis cervina]|nr:hypothetical protein BDW22DRAFT_1399519 [Trametopsis cervina]